MGKRRNNYAGSRAWRRDYKARMCAGTEKCRLCGMRRPYFALDPEGLGFGHLLSWALGGGPAKENTVIVCRACDAFMGAGDWTGYLPSIADEEQV